MIAVHPPTQWVFILSLAFILHWSLVNCTLQHDPGGSWTLDLFDTKAAIGKYFNYTIPFPPSNTVKDQLCHEVSEVGTNSLPTWLVFNKTSHTFHGVPLITDKGFYLMKVVLRSPCGNASSTYANDVFAIDVDFVTSGDLSKKDILSGVTAKPHVLRNTVQQLSKHIECRRNEIKTLMSAVFDVDMKHLDGSSRISLIANLSLFLNQPLEEFTVNFKHSSIIDKLQMDSVIAAGPGNIKSDKSNKGLIVTWPLPCATQTLIHQFPKVMARNIASGHLRDTTGYDVLSWYISELKYSGVKVKGRSKREIGMTVVPTPMPSRTASVVSATSLFSVSSMIQSMQTSLMSTLVSSALNTDQTMPITPSSTLLFSTLSSDQISLISSSTSRFAFSTPIDVSTMQTSEYLQTLTSDAIGSVQPSLSQSLATTGISTSLLSQTSTLLPSSMQISSSSTPEQRTNIYSSYQTPIFSTILENTESTVGVPSTIPFVSSDATLTSTLIFPSFQSTSSLVGSPSLFHSTNMMSMLLSETESPTSSSVRSVGLSVSITNGFSSPSTAILSSESSFFDLSSVFPSIIGSSLKSFESETSFILETSSHLRSESTRLIPTPVGSSDIESIKTPMISTLTQNSGLTPSISLQSTQMPFSSESFTTFLSSSLIVMSSTQSAVSSSATMPSIFHSETPMLTQIHRSSISPISFQSTYQTEMVSNIMTTVSSSSVVTQTHDVLMSTTLITSSLVRTVVQSSDIMQSSSIPFTSAITSSITLTPSFSEMPEMSSSFSTQPDISSSLPTMFDMSSRFSTILEMTSSLSVMLEMSSNYSTSSEILSSFSTRPEVSSSSSTILEMPSSIYSSPEMSSSLSAMLEMSSSFFTILEMSSSLSSMPETSSTYSSRPEMSPSFSTSSEISSSFSTRPEVSSPIFPTGSISSPLDSSFQIVPSSTIVPSTSSGMVSSNLVVPVTTSLIFSSTGTFVGSSSLSNAPFTTDTFLESTYLTEILSSPVFPESSLPLGTLSERQSLSPSFLQTTDLSISTSSEILAISSSGIETTMLPNTIFQTSVFSSDSALSTIVLESTSTPLSSRTPDLSESLTLSIFSLSSHDSLIASSSTVVPQISSEGFLNSSVPIMSQTPSEYTLVTSQGSTVLSSTSGIFISSFSTSGIPILSTSVTLPSTSSSVSSLSSLGVSLKPSEQILTSSLGTPVLSSPSLSLFFSSSATHLPVISTILTQSFPSVSSTPIVSSVHISTPSSLQTTSLGSESDISSTTLFFSEAQSDTPTPSFFATSTHQFMSSSSGEVKPSLSMSDVSSVVIQPSMSPSDMLTSSTGSSIIQPSSTAQTVQTLTSSETPNISSIVTDFRTTSVSLMITSSFPETQSLVSTLSPQLSTSALPMSTRVSSRFVTSTLEIAVSSSSSPTSPTVPSTSELVQPSSTQFLSSSPQLSSTPGLTKVLSSIPSSDFSLPMTSLGIRSSEIQPSPSYSSSVEVVSTPAVTTEPTTQAPEITTEPKNQAPIIQHPIDELILSLGDVLHFSIPEDTFLDPEDGLTFDLQLDLLTTNNQPVSSSNWLQLVNSQKTLSGVPLDRNLTVSENEYLLSATDSEGLVAYDAFVVKVQERATVYNHEFVITLENNFQNFVGNSQNIVSLCDDVAIFVSDDVGAFSIASVSEGSVVVTYSNKTLSTEHCDYEAVNSVFNIMALSNGTPTNAFQGALLPNNRVTKIERIFLNLCLMTTITPVTNVTESSEPGTNLLLETVLPACLVSFLLLFCFIIICCCYKRKRGGEEFLLREEKPIYAKNRKPIYLDGELEDKEPLGASHPVILPIDTDPVKASRPFKSKPRESSRKERPPPPQYQLPDYARVNLGMDDFENDFENNLYKMEPPTYTSQPVIYPKRAHKPDGKPLDVRPPPLYRLPPPYQSQDRGFFDESDI